MALSTYAELQTAIADFLNRDDLGTAAQTFIQLAEAQIARDVRHWRMEKRSTATFDEGEEWLPSDWAETIRLGVVDGREIRMVSEAEMMRLRTENTSGNTQIPVYTIVAGQIDIFPTLSEAVELVYFARVPALSDSNTTNWLLTYAPDVYLYGALMHSAGYLKDDGRVAIWTGLYTAAVGNLNNSSMAAKSSGPLRMNMPRG